jgi:AraC family transcriptional regulator of adaptative response / DNA-3-methyladenine glycosylase II
VEPNAEAVRAVFRTAPSALRRARSRRPPGGDLALRLRFRPPLPWEALLAFLAARATPGVEEVGDGAYRRTFELDGAQGVVEVRAVAGRQHLLAKIRLAAPVPLIRIAERLRSLFDLGADPCAIEARLRTDPRLARRLAALPGVRVPGAFEGFELAVRAVLGQQVSVAAATKLAGRLVRAYGAPLRLDPGPGSSLRLVFPGPAALASVDARRVGLPRARASAVATLARAVAGGALALDGSRDLETSMRSLAALPGIGEWTAQLVAMRALRAPDAFPAGDLGLRRALGRPGHPATPAEARAAAERWRPWRAYAAALLWMGDGAGVARGTAADAGSDAAADQGGAAGAAPARGAAHRGRRAASDPVRRAAAPGDAGASPARAMA